MPQCSMKLTPQWFALVFAFLFFVEVAAAEYTISVWGASACPDGSGLLDAAGCRAAARVGFTLADLPPGRLDGYDSSSEPEFPSDGDTSAWASSWSEGTTSWWTWPWPDWPKGCTVEKDGWMYFNTHPTGAPNKFSALVCEVLTTTHTATYTATNKPTATLAVTATGTATSSELPHTRTGTASLTKTRTRTATPTQRQFGLPTFLNHTSVSQGTASDLAQLNADILELGSQTILNEGGNEILGLVANSNVFVMPMPTGSSTVASSNITIPNFGSATSALIVARVPNSTNLALLGLTTPVGVVAESQVFLFTVDRMDPSGSLIQDEPFSFTITANVSQLSVYSYRSNSTEPVDVTAEGGSVTSNGQGTFLVRGTHTSTYTGFVASPSPSPSPSTEGSNDALYGLLALLFLIPIAFGLWYACKKQRAPTPEIATGVGFTEQYVCTAFDPHQAFDFPNHHEYPAADLQQEYDFLAEDEYIYEYTGNPVTPESTHVTPESIELSNGVQWMY